MPRSRAWTAFARSAARIGLAALAAGVALGPALGAAQEPGSETRTRFRGPFEVVADELEYRSERDVYVARGNVRISQEGRTLTADRALFSNATRVGVASGNVVVVEGGDTLRADFLEFDVDSLLGVVFRGELESTESRYRMSGEEVRKTGVETYVFRDGRFTTCDCPEPGRDPWTVTAESAELELDGYATARNATFEILDVPVLWLPWVVYPLKRERQTGFLVPEIGRSTRSGGSVALPFFWAARPEVNVILTPEYLFDRGFKPGAEVEYVFGERSFGTLYGTFIHDIEVDPGSVETPFDADRWGVDWQHFHELPADLHLRVDATAVSDNNVPFDFDDLGDHRRDRFLESQGFLWRHFGPEGLLAGSAGVRLADDLQSPDDVDRDDEVLQRLPEARLAALPSSVPFLPGLVASADVQYANFRPYDTDGLSGVAPFGRRFYDVGVDSLVDGRERNGQGQTVAGDPHRDDVGLGGPEGDGIFQEGEPLADHGQRLLANPRLAYPLHFGPLEVHPELGWHGTFYDADEAGTELRSLLTGLVDARARLQGERSLPGFGTVTHVVEPRLAWVYVSNQSQDTHPLFVPGTAVPQDRLRLFDLRNRTRDPADRIDDVNALVFGVTNRFLGGSLAKVVTELSLLSEYDFSEGAWGPVVIEGILRPRGRINVRFHASYDVDRSVFADGLFNVGWTHERGHTLGLRYRYLRDVPLVFERFPYDDRFDGVGSPLDRVSQLSAVGRWQVTPHWALTYDGVFSFRDTLGLQNVGGIEYLSACQCWAVRFEVGHDRIRGTQFDLRYRLVGLGDDSREVFRQSRGRGALVDVTRGL